LGQDLDVLHRDGDRARSFGADALQYERARPSYPAPLVDELLADCPGPRVLDVGCGTGKAARLFAARGCLVVGVEPDARMAAVARRSGLHVEEAAFEQWEPAGRRFDLVVSAQAWHWIDPEVGTARAAGVLTAGGLIGLIWNEGVFPPSLLRTLGTVYERRAPGLDSYSVLLGRRADERVDRAARALTENGSFGEPEVRTYAWERVYSRAEWLDQLPTHSDHRALAPDRLTALLADVGDAIDALGGSFPMRYTAWLLTAARRG